MEAGRQLDAEIAEKIAGVPLWRVAYPPEDPIDDWDLGRGYTKDFLTQVEADAFRSTLKFKKPIPDWAKPTSFRIDGPRYSADISAAWELVEKYHLIVAPFFGWLDADKKQWGRTAWAVFASHADYESGDPLAEAPTAAHAICLAALKASRRAKTT